MSEARSLASRTELEMQIASAMIRFEKEFMGRGPVDTRAHIVGDMILVRLKGVLTPSERKLSESQSDRSAYLLKQVRNELLAAGRHLLEAVIRDIVGVPLLSLHTDISTKTGERIFVFTLESAPLLADERGEGANGERRARAGLGGGERAAAPTPRDADHLQNGKQSLTAR